MRPVAQTKVGRFEGNCFAAALASILHLDLSEVPEPTPEQHLDGTWWETFHAWFDSLGLCALMIDQQYPPHRHPTGYGIGIVPGDFEDRYHAVVTLGRDVVFDPKGNAPERFKDKLLFIMFLIPKDPALAPLIHQIDSVVYAQAVKAVMDDAVAIGLAYRAAICEGAPEDAFGVVNDLTEQLIEHLDDLDATWSET